MGTIRLAKGKDRRVKAGHLWIFSGEVDSMPEVLPGEIANVTGANGAFLGKAMVSGSQALVARMITRQDVPVDESFFAKALERCLVYRKTAAQGASCYRLVNSEGDLLPGLIVDVYEDAFVLQAGTVGMDIRKGMLSGLISDMLGTRKAYERDDMPSRRYEELPLTKGFLIDSFDTRMTMRENGVLMEIDLSEGQKTGYYLDQRENRLAAAAFAEGAECLDAFCYNGSFGLLAGRKGAKSVHFLDMSAQQVENARTNARKNGLEGICQFTEANAFDELSALSRRGIRYDMVMLDPPPFTRNKAAVEGAIRGYKEVNLRGIKLTRAGGYLVTSSCSQHVDMESFKAIVLSAATDAGKYLQLVEERHAAKDHPGLLSMVETEYLKFLIFRVH